MKTRRLGNSDMDFTVVGFGAWAIGGGGYEFGWGPQDDDASISAIHRALDLGVNWIDTAHVYGFGRSEEVVGRAIKGRRDGVFVATKCGLLRGEGNKPYGHLKRASVREELEGSLKRLGVDRIDLYQIHWPNPEDQIEEAWEEIAAAVEEGLVRWPAVSNFNVEQLARAKTIHPVTSLQPPYSMLRRGIEEHIIPYCNKHNIGVVPYSPMLSGMLTGKVTKEWVESLPAEDWRRKHNQEYRDPNLSINIDFVEVVLRPIAKKHGVEPGQVAVAWTLRGDLITSAIVGARNPRQVEETIRAAGVELDAEDLDRIENGLRLRAGRLEEAITDHG